MKLSKMSKQARVIYGIILMFIGYSPVLIDLKDSDRKVMEVCSSDSDNNIDEKIFSKKAIKTIDTFENPFLQVFYDNLQNENSGALLAQNDLFSDLYYMPQVVTNKQSPAKAPQQKSITKNESKVILNGEFYGSRLVKSDIQSNFYVDACRLGVPAKVVNSVIDHLSSKIDFRRSLRKGDRFEILYNSKNEMLYSRITTKRLNVAAYRFTSGTNTAYYFENGVKINFEKKNSFGSPLATRLKISSPFGNRFHPIYRRWMHHAGVDLIASHGSPVYAIFDGIVTRASYNHGYGHCIEIKHQSGYSSKYGHLSSYAVRSGNYVKRGQMIGKSGSSGTSTGCHLHLELAKNNKVINPLSLKMLPIESAVVPNMRQFNARKKQIDLIVTK